MLVLYADNILALPGEKDLCHWVREILVNKYEKVAYDDGDKLCYLSMTLKMTNI